MAMNPVVCSREMQFVAGPQTSRFYACEAHEHLLKRAEISCFMPMAQYGDLLESADEGDGECWFCRGIEGP